MKKLIYIIMFACSFSMNGQTLKEIMQTLKGETSEKVFYKDIVNEVVVVNSNMKARFGGGNTRAAIKVNLPKGTKHWYYRVTVTELNSYFSFSEKETLFYKIKENKTPSSVQLTNEGVDFYVIDSNSVSDFRQTGNDNYRHYTSFYKSKTSGFINTSTFINDDLWIGIKNPNMKDGLRVIVEVVAYGDF
jgi:hypothetical protein